MQRFWKKVSKTDGCWEWSGKLSNGYGRITNPSRKTIYAHRASWELHFGQVPIGLCVLHRCDNRKCVRPDHLFLGTKKDNSVDMATKHRAAFQQHPESAPKGEAHGRAKLNDATVRKIRKMHQQGNNPPALALRFGVDASTIRRIVQRKLWKHI